jgi:hypothetical protein
MSDIKQLESRQMELVRSSAALAKQAAEYREMFPLARLIYDIRIDNSELISFKVAVNVAAKTYRLTPSAAALSVVNITSDHNKIGQLKQELFNLSLQKYAINEFLSSHSQAIRALASLRSQGITEDRLIQLNNILDYNGYKLAASTT